MSGIMAIGQGAINMAQAGVQDEMNADAYYRSQRGAKKMALFNKEQAIDLWKKTNFEPQKEELKKAGMNPALMYGKGGQGGTLMNLGADGGNVEAAQIAPMDLASLQNAETQAKVAEAQIRNINADTANKEADTANKPKVGTNLDANTGLTNLQSDIAKIQLEVDKNTQVDKESSIQALAGKLRGEMTSAQAQGLVDQATMDPRIEQAWASLINTYLDNKLKGAQIDYTKRQTQAIADSVAQGYINAYANRRNAVANEENMRTNLMKQIKDAMYQNGVLELGERKLNQELIMGISEMLMGVSTPGATPIKGFR